MKAQPDLSTCRLDVRLQGMGSRPVAGACGRTNANSLGPAAALLLTGLSILGFAAGPARADPTCKTGYVFRLTSPDDHVCVSPASQARAASENARAPLLWAPGSYGPRTCALGFVWRAASPGDLVCVIPARRAEASRENAEAAQHTGP
jgi:hypothetical protein